MGNNPYFSVLRRRKGKVVDIHRAHAKDVHGEIAGLDANGCTLTTIEAYPQTIFVAHRDIRGVEWRDED